MPSEMKVAVCREPRTIIAESRPLPDRKPGEILIRVRRVGVCGTDLHIYAGNQPYIEYPLVPGHEVAGEVVEAEGASGLSPGATVCIMPYMSCGHCIACRQGKTNCCRHMQVLGVHRDGGMAEYISVPEHFVVPADDLSLDNAAMVEFLSIGHHAVSRGGVRPGQRILISGAGAIGIATAHFAQKSGADVTICDTRKPRLDFCEKQLGLNALTVGPHLLEQLSDRTDGEFFDVVFDATGSKPAMETGFRYVAHGGAYVLVSIVNGEISFSDPEFHKREMTLLGSRNATMDDFRAVVGELAANPGRFADMITHRAPLDDLAGHVASWVHPESGVLKPMITV